ncbi:MAG: DNA polymerase III subunit delta [Planctomycetes bacterium GWF2_50_10]|nr:MAG: DNA polymerase III subunit delta [Planctomycetes bacterium GWF2_50_10]
MASKKLTNSSLIYVISGKDDYLLGQAAQTLLDQVIAPEQRPMGLLDGDPDKITITEVFDELRTLPFLSDKRVVVLKAADDFISEHRESLERYFDSPSGPGVLVLTVKSWPSNTKLAKKLATAGRLIEVDSFKPAQLPDFVMTQASSLGKTISRTTAQMLVHFVGDDPGRLSSEVQKLATYVDEAKVIAPDHVEKLIGHNRMFDAFAVINSLMASDAVTAIDKLRAMFSADRDAEYSIVGAFAWQFRRMFSAKAMLAKGANQQQVIGKVRIFYEKENFFRLLSKFSLEQLAKIIQDLAATDYAIKTGQLSAPVAMEELIFKLAAK